MRCTAWCLGTLFVCESFLFDALSHNATTRPPSWSIGTCFLCVTPRKFTLSLSFVFYFIFPAARRSFSSWSAIAGRDIPYTTALLSSAECLRKNVTCSPPPTPPAQPAKASARPRSCAAATSDCAPILLRETPHLRVFGRHAGVAGGGVEQPSAEQAGSLEHVGHGQQVQPEHAPGAHRAHLAACTQAERQCEAGRAPFGGGAVCDQVSGQGGNRDEERKGGGVEGGRLIERLVQVQIQLTPRPLAAACRQLRSHIGSQAVWERRHAGHQRVVQRGADAERKGVERAAVHVQQLRVHAQLPALRPVDDAERPQRRGNRAGRVQRRQRSL
eukprot:scaffold11839_cov124-Isochrysis_galbana.AAC.3